MSLIVRYSDASTYTMVAAKVSHEYIATLEGIAHMVNTNQNRGLDLGLGWVKIDIAGDITSKTACLWHDIVAVSFDSGTTYQTVLFSSVSFGDDRWSGIYPFTLSLIAQAARESSATRYPTSGYQFGDTSISNVHHHGNVTAYPIIHLLPPLFYAPLTENLYDFAGGAVSFTRAAAKVHGGISYPINLPIYDEGLFISSETSQDTPKWTPVTSTIKTIACQIKQTRYPTDWSIGGTASNLLTANQSNAETDTTGMDKDNGTLTRNTSSPLAGTGDFKLVGAGSADIVLKCATTAATTIAGQWYCFQALVKTADCGAGRKIKLGIAWCESDGTPISTSSSAEVAVPTTATVLSLVAEAPALGVKAYPRITIVSGAINEILYADSLMLEPIPTTLTVWTATKNKLTIDDTADTISWTDDSTTVSAVFPTSDYMAGTLVDIVVIDTTDHAVTVAAHPAAGSWTTKTGTLAAIEYPELTLGNIDGSLSNLIEYPYALTSTEYEALDFSLSPVHINTLYIGNQYAENITKGSDGRLTRDSDSVDISGLLAGTDIALTTANTTIAQSEGLSMRWYVDVKDTSIP